MNQPLDELYLRWLYSQVADPDLNSPSRSYWKLCRQMYTTPYTWFIPNDDNRAEDGKNLRDEFAEELDIEIHDQEWLDLDCSMLELILGLSRRLSFLGDGEPREWFWLLVDNLGIRFNDRRSYPPDEVEEVLNNVIWRTYKANGSGGLFPLRRPRGDQREVELWYQLNSYLLERD